MRWCFEIRTALAAGCTAWRAVAELQESENYADGSGAGRGCALQWRGDCLEVRVNAATADAALFRQLRFDVRPSLFQGCML